MLAWLLLGMMRLFVLVAPFGQVRRLLGDHRLDQTATMALAAPVDLRARRIGHVILQAAAHTPWRSECYPQALVARILLVIARIPHSILFGLRRDESGALLAHAWVTAGDTCVVGGDPRSYTVVGSFSWQPTPVQSRKLHGNLRLLRPHAAKRDRAA